MAEFPLRKDVIRLAMLGMVEGNGHPFSWSMIINGGYDPAALKLCPYPGIVDYISRQPLATLGIPGAKVTHVWTDDPADAELVSRIALVPNVVERAEDVIGQVDAVLVATDKGFEHIERARPFIEAGLPVFIDKPLCDNRADLATFSAWVAEGRPILTSSAMRYAKEFVPYHGDTDALGRLRHIHVPMAKSWEAYGIHALESLYKIVGPGFESVQNIGDKDHNIVHLRHRDGVDVTIATIKDMGGAFGMMLLGGTQGGLQLRSTDTFHSFKAQLVAYVDFLKTGQRPMPWAETEELMRLVIAGIESREQGGRKIMLSELGQGLMASVLDSFSLAGKVALVTGGAGLYGRQIVAALAEAGAETYLAARGVEKLEAVAAEERAQGRNVTALSLDLSEDASIERVHAEIISRSGRCDVLVNNAVTRSALNGWKHELDEFDASLRVNASALFKITQLFAQTMKQRRTGSIINIGSMMGMVGLEMRNYEGTDMMPDPSPVYHYEKGGMINFTRWAASILGPDGVRVNCISPGGFFSNQPAPFVANYSKRTQLGRMANDTDLKGAIVFLASDASAYVTGVNLPVDGGYTAK